MCNVNFYLILLLWVLSLFFLVSQLRLKFIAFIIMVIAYSCLGFYYNLDGMILVLLTTEFTVVLLFLMTYMQLYSNYTFITRKSFNLVTLTLLALILPLYKFSNIFFSYVSYYKLYSHVVASDFYILYYILFDKLPILVVILTLVISLFSFFFIVLYFNLKLMKNTENGKLKALHFIRKQNLSKQTQFNSCIYSFQN